MRKKFMMLLLVITPLLTIKGQFLDSLIIKTHPLRDLIAFNPNIGFEKILNKKYSIEVELTYKNRDTEFSGKEFDVWSYKNSSGGRILIGIKRYFKQKKIPNTWYFLTQLGYRDIYLSNFQKFDISGSYIRTVNIDKKDYEINFLIGRGFKVYKNIVTEINFGAGLCNEKYKEKYLKGNLLSQNYKNGYFNTNEVGLRIYFNWTIGYLISKK